jgi:CHAT domain-containing protein
MQPAGKTRTKKRILISLGAFCCAAWVIVQFGAPESASSANETSVKSVAPILISDGASVYRELAAGKKDVFKVTANEGKLLRFSVDKGDLRLWTALYDPTGTKLTEHVSEDFEVVEISFPAQLVGTYRLEIQSQEKVDPPRQYQLTFHHLTTATQRERKDSEARLVLSQATVLRASWTAASLRQAIEQYGKSATIWTSIGESAAASHATMRSGDIYFVLSEYQQALRQYQNANVFSSKADDWLGKVMALVRIGRVESYLGRNDLSQTRLAEAMDLLESHKNNQILKIQNAYGEALSCLAEVTYAKGNLSKSLKQFEDARKVLVNDRKSMARTRLFAGYIAGSIGDTETAVREFSDALDLYRATNDKVGEGLGLTALGLSHSSKGAENGAIDLHRKANEIFLLIGDRHSQAIALNGIGQAYQRLKQYRQAVNNHEIALRLFEDSRSLDGVSFTTFMIGYAHHLSGDLNQALASYERCLMLNRAAGKTRGEANALSEIAKVYASQGRHELTLRQYDKLQKFYQTIGDRRGLTTAMNARGDFLFQLGEKHEALQAYQRAFDLRELVHDKSILLNTLHNLARVNLDLGAPDNALTFSQQSLKIIENLRDNVESPEFRASYFSGVRDHYDLCISILMHLEQLRPGGGFLGEALLVSERSRARLLLDLVSESRGELHQGASELLKRERRVRGLLRSQIQYHMELSLSRANSTEMSEVASQVEQLKYDYQEILGQLRKQFPRMFSLEKPAPLALQQIQNELKDSETIVLEYALGQERSYLWAVTHNSVNGYELPRRKVIEDAAREVYRLTTARQGADGKIVEDYQADVEWADKLLPEKARSLSQMLLGPIAEKLGSRRVVVVCEGAMQLVPFESLPVPLRQTGGPNQTEASSKPSLLDTNEIIMLPSVSVLGAIRSARSHVSSPDKLIAVIADPVFSKNDDRIQAGAASSSIAVAAFDENPYQSLRADSEIQTRADLARLIHASEEVDVISAVAPWGTTMVAKDFDATREMAMSPQFGEYQIIHFATHGFLDSKRPELSGIVLGMVDRNGAKNDGFMSLNDIYSLDLSAQLTVLSACQTALGEDMRGEGLMGVTHGFMSAGSKSVVASLWKVDDRATAVLMSHFYDSMLRDGVPPVAALRAAKLKMMRDKRWSAPYYWSGFVFYGDYETRITVGSNSRVGVGAALLLASLTTAGLLCFSRIRRRRARSQ